MNISYFNRISGPGYIFIAATLWALDGFIRQSLYSLPPIIIVFYEHLLGTALLLPVIIKTLRTVEFSWKEWGILSFIALFSGLLGTLWFTSALVKVQFISVSVVYLIQKLQPIFAISTAALLLKERLRAHFWLWATMGLGAAFFLTFPNGQVKWNTGAETTLAALLALGAAAVWGSNTAFSKLILKKHSAEIVTAMRFLLTTFIGLGFVLWMGAQPQLSQPTASQYLRFGFIAVSTGMVALLLYYQGLKKTPASVTTIIELTFPALVVLLDGLVNNKWLTISQYLAAIVLSFAMYKVSALSKTIES